MPEAGKISLILRMRLSRTLFYLSQVWQWATIGPCLSRDLRTLGRELHTESSEESADMRPAAQICADLQAAQQNAHLTNMFEDEMYKIFSEILGQSFPQPRF
jgi:hypothetical protein